MTSKLLATLSAAILLTPAVAFATTEIDANGDWLLTFDEVQAVFPEITVESFSAMDVNADGALDADDIAAAEEEAGLMPPTEG